MTNRNTAWIYLVIGILVLGVMVGLIWANHRFIAQDTGLNQFAPRWYGTRLFLTKGLNPYLPETVNEIEKVLSSSSSPGGQVSGLFLHPFYSFIIYAPFALTDDIILARTAWMTVLEIAVIAMAALSLSLSRWKISKPFLVLLILFVIAWYFTIRVVWNGDIAAICGILIIFSLLAIRAEQDALAGIVLALAAIKPTLVVLLVIFLLMWAISTHRWQIFWGFLGALGLSIAATSLLVPSWLADNIRQVVQYLEDGQAITPGSLVAYWLPGIGRQFGWLLSIVTAIVLIVEWRLALKKDFRWLLWTAYLTLAITPLSGIPTSLDNYLVMFPGLVLILATWDERWGTVGRWLMFISLLLLSFGVWGFIFYGSQQGMNTDQNPLLFFIMPLFSLLGLYWVRWWAIRPPRLFLQEVANRLG